MAASVLFIVPYPEKVAPSQRFRVELYEPILSEAGIKYSIAPYWDRESWDIIYKPGNILKKATSLIKGYLRRLSHLFKATHYDYIFIHREAMPIGPPVYEWVLAKILGKKIIYDFDDAIWLPNTTKANKLAGFLKSLWKVKYICRWSAVTTAGNRYLQEYANRYAPRTVFLPTCVETDTKHNKLKQHGDHKPVVGWTGSHSTLSYLDDIIPTLKELQAEHPFTFLVIADKKPDIDLPDWEFIKWNETTEVADLLRIDIGIMPLKAGPWSEGKCGFKLIQYLSCGIPAIADAVGANKDIVVDGVNGFLCENKEDWKQSLKKLISDPGSREQMGKAGRMKIVEEYSIRSQKDKFLSLFK
jgi:glycosyltransferase involved in cell wall biosynthesis